jgi:hypothetical protein
MMHGTMNLKFVIVGKSVIPLYYILEHIPVHWESMFLVFVYEERVFCFVASVSCIHQQKIKTSDLEDLYITDVSSKVV